LIQGSEKEGFSRNSVAVIIRATVIPIPGIVRIIIRLVGSIIFRFGRVTPVIDVVSIGAAAK